MCVFRAAGGPTPARGPRPLASRPGVSGRRRSQGGAMQGAPSCHAKINDFNINDMLLILYNIRKKPSY